MATEERDGARGWRLPQASRPPLVAELVERIDEALATARAAEAAAVTIGAAALDQAEEARRIAGLAARSAPPAAPGGRPRPGPAIVGGPPREGVSDPLDGFSARADRIAERLRRLQRLPLSA